jgi:hypothetical protein
VLIANLYRARLRGTMAMAGGQVTITDGLIGGAVSKDELIKALETFPAKRIADVSLDFVITFFESLDEDIDLDGDGTDDAFSIGLQFSAVPATMVGVTSL